VLSARLAKLIARLPEPDQAVTLPLLDVAGEQLSRGRAELLDALAREEYVTVLSAAVAAVTAPRWIDGEGDGQDDVGVRRLARKPWRRLRDYVRDLDAKPDDSQLHRVRILAKRARYAADACVPAVGDAAATCAARLADVQTVLGDEHDAVVTREWLQRQAVATPDISFVAGQLAALELINIGDARRLWRGVWTAASRKQDWQWLRS
jgi:CHAD domain-containing protein